MSGQQQFWMVLADNSKETTVRHRSLDDAQREAKRLATNHPGVRFWVLEAKGCMEHNAVVWTPADDIPF